VIDPSGKASFAAMESRRGVSIPIAAVSISIPGIARIADTGYAHTNSWLGLSTKYELERQAQPTLDNPKKAVPGPILMSSFRRRGSRKGSNAGAPKTSIR
jgi:hypothetical protein